MMCELEQSVYCHTIREIAEALREIADALYTII